MPLPKIYIVSTFLLLCLTLQAWGQGFNKSFHTKSPLTKNRYNYRASQVGHKKAKTICPIFENSKYPYQGLGFKMGDPFAFTYKFYPRKHLAFVADVGRPASGLYSTYFREQFLEKRAEIAPNLSNVEYSSHRVKSDFIVETRALYQFDATIVSKGLQVYTGIGWEFRTTKVDYDFNFNNGPNPEDGEFARVTNSRSTQGIQAVVGIEYAYFQLPISAFMEMEYYVDVMLDPGQNFLQGGIGLRYVF
ncbi:MAG: hypothetical protein O9302_04660 [Cyclobacteriaceae bacterium]|jgi:hypothetical protein|nr:hypothetical protein [Flammeovirgaceae bacterium]MCZ8022950.1 hypothetical protein [Cytophagales bacterium]MCZ8327326.1 hypothetical protein [Cyclobacteriaceae bacterium]